MRSSLEDKRMTILIHAGSTSKMGPRSTGTDSIEKWANPVWSSVQIFLISKHATTKRFLVISKSNRIDATDNWIVLSHVISYKKYYINEIISNESFHRWIPVKTFFLFIECLIVLCFFYKMLMSTYYMKINCIILS